MALIFCPECGTQVSEHAEQCIKCAYPIGNRHIINPQSNQSQNTLDRPVQSNSVEVNNTIIWFLAFAPIIGSFLQGVLFGFMTTVTHTEYNYSKFWWVTLGFNILLCTIDDNNLKKKGIDTEKMGSSWLVPVYLYKRAEVLNQEKLYFWVWIGTFILSFFL